MVFGQERTHGGSDFTNTLGKEKGKWEEHFYSLE